MIKKIFALITLIFLVFTNIVISQITIKELPTSDFVSEDPIFFNRTSTRQIIPLNSGWFLTTSDENAKKVKVSVPSSFVADEVIIYEKIIQIEPSLIGNSRFKVHFHGINYSADIYLNDLIIYKKAGGNIPFSVELPNNLLNQEGKNKLSINISDELDSKSTIPLYQRFLFSKSVGGIIREAYLEIIPNQHLELIDIRSKFNSTLTNVEIEFNIRFKNLNSSLLEENNYGIKLDLFNEDSDLQVASISSTLQNIDSETEIRNLKISLDNPQLWSTQHPNRYIVKLQLMNNDSLLDESNHYIPLFSINYENDKITFNGKEFLISGVTYIPSNKELGELTDYATLTRDLKLIKELGINTVRFAKAAPHPFALQLCEKLGLVALIEIPLNSIPTYFSSDPNFRSRSIRYLEEYTNYYKKYSAVLAIGVGSSFLSNSIEHFQLIEDFAGVVKSRSNKFSYASFVGYPKSEIKNLDLYGIEIYSENISEVQSNFELIANKISSGKLFISESTYPSYVGNTNGYLNQFSLEAQAKYFEDIIDLAEEINIRGFFINSMFDYRGDFNTLYTKYNPEMLYRIGILDEDRNINRISYNVIKSKLSGGNRITIPLGSKKDDTPLFFIFVGLALSIIMGVLVNSKKKFRVDATRALLRPYNFFADIRDHRIMSGFHTVILMFILAGAHALLLTNLFYFFRSNILLEKILITFGVPSILDLIGYFAWHPLNAFLFLSIVSIILFIVITLLIKAASFFTKTKVYTLNIYFAVIWAILPMALLLPLKMVLYKILSTDIINYYIYIFLALYFIWILQRIIKGVYVIFDVGKGIVYFYSFLFGFFIIGGSLLYFQLTRSTIYYIINSIKQFQLM
ncbi:MAG: hypothetical protein KAQ90_08210 [Melioribacteraceae bacterium]|nr:hypothetical protein [Melioribacteraceae bacterium]